MRPSWIATGVRRRFVIALIAVLATITFGPTLASAHAAFVRGTPGPNDVLSTAPAQIDAYFAQNIRTLSGQETFSLWVTDANGDQVDNNDDVLDPANPRHMTVTLPGGLAAGVYTVHWYTVSDEDGDDDSGQYTFTIQ